MNRFVKILFSLCFVLTILLLVSCVRKDGAAERRVVRCSAEKLSKNKKSFVADNNPSVLFSSGNHRTSKESHSGKYSVMATKANPFVLSHTIKNVGPDKFFNVSVWRKSDAGHGVLVVSDKTAEIVYHTMGNAEEEDKNGWEKLEIEFFTPPNFINKDIKVYCWSNNGDTVYFDDIEIVAEPKTYPVYKEEPLILILDTLDYKKLMKKRIKAFDAGVLQSEDNDWVKGIVFGDGKMMKAKMRLKGDWLDHLIGDKWSFRIKMRKKYAWNRLRVFSIQTPFARSFLDEWYSHKLYESKDILTTRYGFVPVIIGNRSRGIYAWEEHFVKQLIESRNRREGPILKFSEDAFWQMQRVAKATGKWRDLPFYNVSVIEPFSQGKTLENPALYKEFLIGQQLMSQYKYKKAKPVDIFDFSKLAKYYAMLEITHARHGMVWHNQRLYYNPVICKLEPIAYDGYTDHTILDLSLKENMAYNLFSATEPFDKPVYSFIFEDTAFLNLYLTFLEEYSSKSFVDSISNNLAGETAYYDSLINIEFPYVHFDKNFLKKSAGEIRKYLPELKSFLDEKIKNNTLHIIGEREDHTDSVISFKTPEFYVTAYKELRGSDSSLIGVHNFFGRELKVVGTGVKKRFISNYFSDKIVLKAYVNGDNGVVKNINVEPDQTFLFFQVDGSDEIFSIDIKSWPYPSGFTPRQELDKTINLVTNKIIDTIIGDEIIVKTGNLKINKPLIFPQGYRVTFKAGTKIDLVHKAMIISYSPVFIQGNKEMPVVIYSSDKTGNGFTILQADKRSKIDFAEFRNMNTLSYKGWVLTGSVTFYESDVDITNTSFIDNQCEDALNIVRSDFLLQNSLFKGTWGDAFDSDFSKGLVDKVVFTNIGNDAIDFSGSKIEIINTTIDGAEDKGISGGEDSHLIVRNTVINHANIGMASKDLSSLNVFDSKIDDCKYGLVLLQKKPEYGPATMNLQKVTITNTSVRFLIEKGSEIVFNRKIIKGDKKNVAKMFY